MRIRTTGQAVAILEIALKKLAPVLLHAFPDLGESVAGEVHQALPRLHFEEVDELGPPWRFARTGELAAVDDDIDCAGLASVGAPGHSHFPALVGQELGG